MPGAGFLEKVCERALREELNSVESNPKLTSCSRGLIVELKCVERFSSVHLAQCISYLKASGLSLALLINFRNPKVEWKRIVYSR